MDDQTASRLYEMSMRGKGPYDVISVNSEENNDVFDDGASREAEDDSFPDVHAPPPVFRTVLLLRQGRDELRIERLLLDRHR